MSKKVVVELSGGQASVIVMLLKERLRKIEKELAKNDVQGKQHHPAACKTRRRCQTALHLILAQWKGQTGEELPYPCDAED